MEMKWYVGDFDKMMGGVLWKVRWLWKLMEMSEENSEKDVVVWKWDQEGLWWNFPKRTLGMS